VENYSNSGHRWFNPRITTSPAALLAAGDVVVREFLFAQI
jgi:hypothetical protein